MTDELSLLKQELSLLKQERAFAQSLGENWTQLRVAAAIAAMQGFCSNPNMDQVDEKIAKWAIAQAESLIKELQTK